MFVQRSITALVLPFVLASLSMPTWGSPGTVISHQKISATSGGFTGALNGTSFGTAVGQLWDLDGDAVNDLIVGEDGDSDVATGAGAIWVLLMNADGTVKAHQKITTSQGGFTGSLTAFEAFGIGASSIGDLDNDGVDDIAVGTFLPGPSNLWILFLNSNGTVKGHFKNTGFAGGTNAVAGLGDLNGDNVEDVAIGEKLDNDGGTQRGAVEIAFLNPAGAIPLKQKISSTQGGFYGLLDNNDFFGSCVASLGDLDGDGIGDIAVGASQDDDGGPDRGAIWIVFLNASGTVKLLQKISSTAGAFTGALDHVDLFGYSCAGLPDLDGDGVQELTVGAFADDDGGTDVGAAWILFLNDDGTVKAHQKISATAGNFSGALDSADAFSFGVASLGDFNGNGVADLAVTAAYDDDGLGDNGAAWILFLDGIAPTATPTLCPTTTPTSTPTPATTCGNSTIDTGEECDDGDMLPGDGCSALCMVETGWSCSGEPSICTDTCGDGIVDPTEQCDLGSGNCLPSVCCASGCSSTCRVQGQCTGNQACCTAAASCGVGEGCCGNAIVEGDEACDDGNSVDGDCCDASCQQESPSCVPNPPICAGVSGPHLITNPTIKRTLLRDASPKDGNPDRWTATGNFIVHQGQSIDPDTEEVDYVLSQSDGAGGSLILYEPHLAPPQCPNGICFIPRQTQQGFDLQWRFRRRGSEPDIVDAPGWRNGVLKRRAATPNDITFTFKGRDGTLPAPALIDDVRRIRQTIRIGDDCITTTLDCTTNSSRTSFQCRQTLCGDGVVTPGEKCGESTLPACPPSRVCDTCRCIPPP